MYKKQFLGRVYVMHQELKSFTDIEARLAYTQFLFWRSLYPDPDQLPLVVSHQASPADVQTFSVTLPDGTYQQPPQRAAFVETLLERVEARPDVEAAGAIFGLPLTDFSYSISVSTLDGVKLSDDDQKGRSVQVRAVTPAYFRALEIPVRRGRSVTTGDRAGSTSVALVYESAPRRGVGG